MMLYKQLILPYCFKVKTGSLSIHGLGALTKLDGVRKSHLNGCQRSLSKNAVGLAQKAGQLSQERLQDRTKVKAEG